MKLNLLSWSLMLLMVFSFSACNDDDGPAITTSKSVSIVPEGLQNPVISNVIVTLKNITTGTTEKQTYATLMNNELELQMAEGLYNINLEADITYTIDGEEQAAKIRGSQENVNFVGEAVALDLKPYLYHKDAGLVIAEIFFTGTATPENKQYGGDQYFVIYNNSDEVIYADGYAIAESEFRTTTSYVDLVPDDRETNMAIQALYRIPGSGKDHPLNPGESLLICDNAIDHREANANSFDMRKADFEWYDVSSSPRFQDVDNPEVPNLDKIYCYTATIWHLHNRGFQSYALLNMGTEKLAEEYLKDYAHHYEYLYVWANGSFTSKSDCYTIPNEWIVDAVNLSVESEFEDFNISKKLDQGWTYCGKVDRDKTRYGKSVRRKVLSGKVLQDTNDSSKDFLPEQTADPFFKFHE